MNDFPKLQRATKSIREWSERVRDWCVEHHVALVKGGGSLERFPTGTVLNAGTGSDGTLTLYFIDGGVLKQADFSATNIITV